jgi:nitroreductase
MLIMDFSDLIKKRRSIRRYKSEMPSMDLIEQCIEAACNSPSAHNSQPWKFIIVKNRQKLDQLGETQRHSKFLKNAPMAVVVLAEEELSNHFVEDCSAAIMLLMLRAADLGLGTCWNAVYGDEKREKYVRGVLGLPEKYRVICNLAIGYPDEEPGSKTTKSFEEAAEVIE